MRFIHTRRNAFGWRAFWTNEMAELRSHWAFLAVDGVTYGELDTAKEEATELRKNFRDMILTERKEASYYRRQLRTAERNLGRFGDREGSTFWADDVTRSKRWMDRHESNLAFLVECRNEITEGLRAWDVADRDTAKRIKRHLKEWNEFKVKDNAWRVAHGEEPRWEVGGQSSGI